MRGCPVLWPGLSFQKLTSSQAPAASGLVSGLQALVLKARGNSLWNPTLKEKTLGRDFLLLRRFAIEFRDPNSLMTGGFINVRFMRVFVGPHILPAIPFREWNFIDRVLQWENEL